MSLPRRFYKTVTVTPERGIALDGKPVKTPLKAVLQLPTLALAEAVAAEWEAQGRLLNPASMILTKLANTAIDRMGPGVIDEMLDYAGSDLVCYRADRPPDLVQRHADLWDPVVAWAQRELHAPFEVHIGVVHKLQPAAALSAVRQALEACDGFEIAAIHTIMTLTGSALSSLMLARGALSPEKAWAAAHADEDFQIAQWGDDDEAVARRVRRRSEFDVCCRFLALLKA